MLARFAAIAVLRGCGRCLSAGCGAGAVYIHGQVLGGTGFPGGNRGLHCQWELVTGTNWRATQGLTKVRDSRMLEHWQRIVVAGRSRSCARRRRGLCAASARYVHFDHHSR